jgi:hypothetical protein
MHTKLLTAAGLVAGSLLWGSGAYAAPCSTAPVATYTAGGFSCNVGPVTFSNFVVTTPTGGSGTVSLGMFSPFTTLIGAVTEYGFSLSYAANTGATPGSTADVALTYNVAANLLNDAFASFAGTTTGTGTSSLAETLSNGVTLNLNAPGSTTASFPPIGNLSAIKDQNDFSGAAGSSMSSILQNAFSVTTPIPEPASLALLGSALAGFGWISSRRRKNR